MIKKTAKPQEARWGVGGGGWGLEVENVVTSILTKSVLSNAQLCNSVLVQDWSPSTQAYIQHPVLSTATFHCSLTEQVHMQHGSCYDLMPCNTEFKYTEK